MTVKNRSITLNIWDTVGQERFVVLVFDNEIAIARYHRYSYEGSCFGRFGARSDERESLSDAMIKHWSIFQLVAEHYCFPLHKH